MAISSRRHCKIVVNRAWHFYRKQEAKQIIPNCNGTTSVCFRDSVSSRPIIIFRLCLMCILQFCQSFSIFTSTAETAMLSTAISDGAAVIESVSEAERSSLDLDAQSRMVAVYGMKGQVRCCCVHREF